jgi:hypothetical protein
MFFSLSYGHDDDDDDDDDDDCSLEMIIAAQLQ